MHNIDNDMVNTMSQLLTINISHNGGKGWRMGASRRGGGAYKKHIAN